MSESVEIISEKEFEEKTKSGVVVIDFFATWCAPCRMMGSIIETEILPELDEKVKIYKVNVDDSEALAKSFGIMSIPTLIVFKDGNVKEKHIGLWSKEEMLDCINGLI